MPSERSFGFLEDILRNIDLANAFIGGLTYEDFEKDTLRLYGVTRCLEIISEASRGLSDEFKSRNPKIVWREMAGAGNVYRHSYQDVAARRIWETVRLALPPLRAVIEQELAQRG
jgi:uncharacterized protein with HEPN domain